MSGPWVDEQKKNTSKKIEPWYAGKGGGKGRGNVEVDAKGGRWIGGDDCGIPRTRVPPGAARRPALREWAGQGSTQRWATGSALR